jgi:hypothetical protein
VSTTSQNTALGRRLSKTKFDRFSQSIPDALAHDIRDFADEFGVRVPAAGRDKLQVRQTNSVRSVASGSTRRPVTRKSISDDPSSGGLRQLSPIPASPYTTDHSSPSSPSSRHSKAQNSPSLSPKSDKGSTNGRARSRTDVHFADSIGQARGKPFTINSQPQSLNAALEMLALSEPDRKSSKSESSTEASFATASSYRSPFVIPSIDIQSDSSSLRSFHDIPPLPSAQVPPVPVDIGTKFGGKGISGPLPNHGKILYRNLVSF